MPMKKLFLLFICSFLIKLTVAQHFSLLSQYELCKNIYNPSAITSDKFYLNLTYRNQWTGFDDAPKLAFLNAMYKSNNMSFGLFAINDKAGIFEQNIIQMNYAYLLKLDKEMWLSFGVSGGINIYGIKFSELNLSLPNDPIAFLQNGSTVLPDFNLGLTYIYSTKIYAGFSIQHILGVTTSNSVATDNTYLGRHFYFMGGYKHKFSDTFSLSGSLLTRYMYNVPFEIELGVKSFFINDYWAGISYRSNNDLIFQIGFLIAEQVLIGYAFDLSLSKIPNKTSHEIVLGLKIRDYKSLAPKF
jgi:type IX secretion system PorP/SprF family membrane protein